MRYQHKSLAPLLLSAGVICGCSVFTPTVEVELRLPSLPQELRRDFSDHSHAPLCRILYENGFGIVCKQEIPYSRSLVIEIAKKENAAVLVYPPLGIRPFGGFFNGRRIINLSWEAGFLAETVSSAENLSVKNWNPQTLIDKIEDNPWFHDAAILLRALTTGTVNRYSLKKKERHPVLLTGIPEGVWLNRYPRDKVTVDHSGEFRTDLPEGYELFINPEQKQMLSLYVTESGDIPFMLTEYE